MKGMEYVFDHGCIFSYVNDFKDVAGAANVVYGSETFTDEDGATKYNGRIHCKTLVDVKAGDQILAEYGKSFWFPREDEVFEEEDPNLVGCEVVAGFLDNAQDDLEQRPEEDEEESDNADPGDLDPSGMPVTKKKRKRLQATQDSDVEEVPASNAKSTKQRNRVPKKQAKPNATPAKKTPPTQQKTQTPAKDKAKPTPRKRTAKNSAKPRKRSKAKDGTTSESEAASSDTDG
jgi:hypothetical protein